MARLIPVWGGLALGCLVLLGPATARGSQELGPGGPERGRDDLASRPAPHGRPCGPGHGLLAGRELFEPRPEDRGPLRTGEEAELLAFAREHMPRLGRALDEVRARKPERFQAMLDDAAPRLRHLRHVFEVSPRVGSILRAHAENMFAVRRQMRELRSAAPGTPAYDSARQAARERLAASVQLEVDALTALADDIAAGRDTRVDARATELIAVGADLSVVPERIRRRIDDYHAAGDDAARTAAREQVRVGLAQLTDDEVAALRQRASRLSAAAAEEVDRRLDRLLDAAARGEPGPRRERPDGGRHGPASRPRHGPPPP